MPDSAADATPVLSLSGDVDIATEPLWRERGDALLDAHPHLRDVTVDMSQVSFLDSRGMAVLVHLHARALDRGGKLSVCAVTPRIMKALRVAGLDQVFQIDGA